jgi:uncharacterized protein
MFINLLLFPKINFRCFNLHDKPISFNDIEGIMKSNHETILHEFSAMVRRTYPDARIWMFGSYARGTASPDSDLDICVVLPQVQGDDRFTISDMAWEASLVHDVHLSTVVLPAADFESGPVSVSPLLHAVRDEGVPASASQICLFTPAS